MATSLTLEQMTSTNTKKSRSITNINPAATDQQLVNLATALNDLTTNTLKGVNRVDKTEIDPNVVYTPVVVSLGVTSAHYTQDGNTFTFDNKENVLDNYLVAKCNNIVIPIGDFSIKNEVNTADAFFFYYYINPSGLEGYTLGISAYAAPSEYTKNATCTVTFPGGSVTKSGTTYYYASFTIKLIQLV